MYKTIWLFTILCFFVGKATYGQLKSLDSIQKAIEQMPSDTAQVNQGIRLLNQFYKNGYNQRGIDFGSKMIRVSDSLGYEQGTALLANRLGTIWANVGGHDDLALDYHKKALAIREKINDQFGIGISLNNIGNIYRNLAQDVKAIEYYLKSLEVCEKINDQDGVAYALKNAAIVYEYQGWYEKALEYQLRALAIREKLSPNSTQHGASLYNLGLVYHKMSKYDSAMLNLEKALKICQKEKYEIEDEVLMEMGGVYFHQKNYPKALHYYQLALEKSKQFEKRRVLSDILTKITTTYVRLSDGKLARENLKIHQKLLDTLDYKRGRIDYYYAQYETDSLGNDELSALRFFKKYSLLKDSVLNETTSKEMKQAQNSIAVFQKESEIRLEQAKQDYQKIIWISLVIFLAASMVGLSYTVFTKTKANRLLKTQQNEINGKNHALLSINEEMKQQQEEILAQRDQISVQKDELLETSQQIQNNIRSALTIQQAALPSDKSLGEALGEYFVLYRPKDVVSGDFYWLNQVGNKIILAVVDCTGHGVSGAFMSLIGINLLNRITNVNQVYEPSTILNHLQMEVQRVLRQEETNNREGMDLSIISFDKSTKQTEQTCQILFSGAKRSLFYISPEKSELVKGTRKGIGGRQNAAKKFETQSIELSKNSIIYLFTDGFADQNDYKRNSFSETRLLNYLLSIRAKPMKEQKILLDDVLDDFSFNTYQRDDILILGFRL